jgi:hypothetical protein
METKIFQPFTISCIRKNKIHHKHSLKENINKSSSL